MDQNDCKTMVDPTKKKRSTHQKKMILDTLVKLGSHVSAGAIYKELKDSGSEIGRATVFRVLSEMANEGILLRVQTIEGEDRFDITVQDHCHVVCRSCGKVDDVWFNSTPLIDEFIKSAADFTLERTHLEFIGLCKNCAEKRKNN